MNEQLIEQITKMVVEKLQTTNVRSDVREKDRTEMPVQLYQQSATGNFREEKVINTTPGNVKFFNTVSQEAKPSHIKSHPNESIESDKKKEEELAKLRKKTPARIAVGRAGSRPKTNTWLQFRYDHAAAVDAVYGEVPKEILDGLNFFQVQSKVVDKEEYIRRPDLGRRLSDDSVRTVKEKCKHAPTVQIVASNGLSAKAIEENLEDVYLSLEQSLNNLNIDMGTTFYIDKGRVALMDEIGEILQPDVVIILIGERPGLVSAESLSAYICYKPRFGTIEADRMVVSNIHKGGIPPVEAGAYLGTLIQKILKHEASGVSLVKKEG
ncbi:ethanolamine ammonia-lyase subunit EutC [Sporosarcina sp. HYO08]|uniref:ethanolamine ammonia-lyase subunit EutC n=1 Tax=Sporosarcina sp. HYO08 TaxID=1759557 RepID=UPI00079A9BAB|nr:ethanolamine ammonia-lyase subunit EutC [Sporosarcina sp. HYO08]KXH83834.1 ethanolamine ammonia-lyase [Sporosarcina sp. HYO08]